MQTFSVKARFHLEGRFHLEARFQVEVGGGCFCRNLVSMSVVVLAKSNSGCHPHS